MDAPPGNWRLAARLLHWATALLCLAALGLALYLVNPPDWSPVYVARYKAGIGYHKLLGLMTLAVAAAWVLLRGRRPPLTGPAIVRLGARAVHTGLWVLLFVMPLSGYFGTVLYGGHVGVARLVDLTLPLPRDERLGHVLGWVHHWGGYGLLVLLAVHFAGIFYHVWFRKDDVVRRMLGARPSRPAGGTE